MRYLRVLPEGEGFAVELAEAPAPKPAPGEVLVRVAASGVNRADLSQIAGHYPAPPGESEILGLELSGTAVESGQRVCALVAGGAHAEYAAVPVGQLFPAPAELDFSSAAGIPEAFLTAFLNLVVEGGLGRGGRALVHAGASGVGLAAIQVATYLGAETAATTRSASKLAAIAGAGADLAIDSTAQNFAEATETRWGTGAIDVILDPIGGPMLPGDLRVLAPGGRILFLATMAGARAELDIRALMGKRGRVIGSTLRSRPRAEKAELVARFQAELLPGFESGALHPTIDSVFPPSRAAEAFERMKQNRNAGKIVIDWS